MQLVDHLEVAERLGWEKLIDRLREGFAAERIEAPDRQILTIPLPDGQSASLLLMPAWEAGRSIGVKVVTFFPQNAAKGQPTINAGYLLFDGDNGRALAAIDGDAMTERRTAATSALAADYLARPDARVLLICGTGQVAATLAAAHASIRDYDRILVWGRSADKARARADEIRAAGLPGELCLDLEAGCRSADVISSATAATKPFLRGAWIGEGTHLDLIGAFKGDMRECDTQAITQARVFVDGHSGALLSGDLADPVAEGQFNPARIAGDIVDLTRGTVQGRRSPSERTVFKSVGLSAEDLIAATLAAESGLAPETAPHDI